MGNRPIAPRAPALPPVFWGALGCVSVLGVGFTILFLVGGTSSSAARPAVARPAVARPQSAVALPAPPVSASARPSPDIQPLAPQPSASPPVATAPAPHPKPPIHLIKVARAPAVAANVKDPSKSDGKPEKKAASAGADEPAGDSDEAAALAAPKAAAPAPTKIALPPAAKAATPVAPKAASSPAAKTTAKTAKAAADKGTEPAAEDDQPVARHRERASDDPEDD